MISRKEKKWIHGLFALLISLLLLVFSHGTHFGGFLSSLASDMLSLPEYPVRILRNNFDDILSWMDDRNFLLSRIKELERDNIRLKTVLGVSKNLASIKEIDQDLKTARITFRPPSAWWSECRINKGTVDGIEPGQLVLQDGMLVGRVAAVEKNFSWVELLTSSSLLIPAVIDDTRDLAVVRGDNNGNIWLIYLPDGSRITHGMEVRTAMVNEMTPPGIPIGRIADTEKRLLGNSKAIPLVMEGDLSRLYEVTVLPSGGDY